MEFTGCARVRWARGRGRLGLLSEVCVTEGGSCVSRVVLLLCVTRVTRICLRCSRFLCPPPSRWRRRRESVGDRLRPSGHPRDRCRVGAATVAKSMDHRAALRASRRKGGGQDSSGRNSGRRVVPLFPHPTTRAGGEPTHERGARPLSAGADTHTLSAVARGFSKSRCVYRFRLTIFCTRLHAWRHDTSMA